MTPRSIVVVSDLHCGCRMGLCPPEGVPLDDGGQYLPSALQGKVWSYWREFWDDWVPSITRGEPWILVVNGDALDGVHHRATTQISHNLADQGEVAYRVLSPVVAKAAAYYHVRGTEAHVGPSGAEEERLAQRLGAVEDSQGQHSRWELNMVMGGELVNFGHHIGTTGSSAYEATALGKEMVESYVEAGRWGQPVPRVIVRSHRHRYGKWEVQGKGGSYIVVVTPAWQLKTPYVYRIAGGRVSPPQLGGVIIRAGDEELHTRAMVRGIMPPAPEVIGESYERYE